MCYDHFRAGRKPTWHLQGLIFGVAPISGTPMHAPDNSRTRESSTVFIPEQPALGRMAQVQQLLENQCSHEMIRANSCKIFEQISNAPFTATGIRPGGLDLTRQALVRSKLPAGSRILDVGCGTGVTVEYLLYKQMIQAVGIDSSSMLVGQGKLRDATLPLLMGDAGALPFPDGSFDGVLLECTLSVVRDRERVLEECYRVLQPRGRLIVTDLYARNPEAIGALRRLSLQSCLKGALNKDDFIHECAVVGFVLDCFEDHSETLRDFAAQIVWTYGSLDRFWSETGASCADSGWIRGAIREARPGYFLYAGSKAVGQRAEST